MRLLLSLSLMAVLFVIIAPLSAGATDLGDKEDFLLFAADTGSANPSPSSASPPSETLGTPPTPTNPRYEYGPGRFRWKSREGYGPRHSRWEETASYLGLTKDQVAKMRDIWSRYYLDTRDLRFDLAEKWLEMHRLFTDPKATSQAILAKDRELMVIRDRLMTKKAEAIVDCRSILTPQQMQKLDVMVMSRYWRSMGGLGRGMMVGRGR